MIPITYQPLQQCQLTRELFSAFHRRQAVTNCWIKENDRWTLKYSPFIDDWSDADFEILISCLKNTLSTGGFLMGGFLDHSLKAFASVESQLFGSDLKYLELSSIHVSEDLRGQGVGKELFRSALHWAGSRGASHLYIASHPAAETQAFYRAMNCSPAQIYLPHHADDIQLQCPVFPGW